MWLKFPYLKKSPEIFRKLLKKPKNLVARNVPDKGVRANPTGRILKIFYDSGVFG